MEENKEGRVFNQPKGIAPREGKNFINLRQMPEAGASSSVRVATEEKSADSIMREALSPEWSSNFLDNFLEIGIYLLIFLLPIFVLPFSFEIHEFNKAFLLVSGASILLLIWTVNSIFIKRKIHILKSPLNGFFLLFVAAIFFSGLLGVDRPSSFLGYYGNFSDSFVFYFGLFVFYLLATNLILLKDSDKVVARMISVSVYSSIIVSLSGLLSFWKNDFFSFLSVGGAGFNLTSGYPSVFAVYLLAMLFLAIYDASFFNRFSLLRKMIDGAAALLILVNLVLLDWFPAYAVLLVFSAILVLSGLLKKKEQQGYGRAPIALLVVSGALFFSGVNFDALKTGQVSFEDSFISNYLKTSLQVPANSGIQEGFDRKEAVEIAKASFKENPILGSGTGTYYYDFSKYKTAGFNYDQGWFLRFGKAYNEMLEKVSTIGALGILSYLLLIFSSLFLFIRNAGREKRDFYLLASFSSLLVFQFFSVETAVLKFMFVLFIVIAIGRWLSGESRFAEAVSSVKTPKKIFTVDFSDKGNSNKIFHFGGILSVALCLITSFFSIQFFRAEAAYKEISRVSDFGTVDLEKMDKVTRLNPFKGEYYVGASRVYISRVNDMISRNKNDQSSLEQIRLESEKVLSNARKAVEISPNNVFFWENYGYVYERISALGMEGAEEDAVKGFENAVRLDPQNAIFQTEIGKVYMMGYRNQNLSEEERSVAMQKAKTYFDKALGLKNDYPEAVIERAFISFYEGDKSQALAQVDRAAGLKKISIPAAVRIGQLYYNLGKKEEAKEVLLAAERIIAKSKEQGSASDNSDMHYMLGIIYQEEERYEEAKAQFREVLLLNPGNAEIMKKISEIENGKKEEIKDNAEQDVWTAGSDEKEEDGRRR